MLHRKNFCRCHQSSLASVFDGNGSGLQSNNRFSAANISLQQTIHRHTAFQVLRNFSECAFSARQSA